MKDILVDKNDDLIFENGEVKIADSLIQEIGIILRLQQGNLKSDSLLGSNLIQLEKGTETLEEFKKRVKIHLKRDDKGIIASCKKASPNALKHNKL